MFDKKNFPTVAAVVGLLPTNSRVNLYSGWQVTAVTHDRAGEYNVMLA